MAETLQMGKSKIVRTFQTIFIVIITLISVASIATSSTIIFHNNYYEVFWVNGQSMYPTLNKNAKRADGTLIGFGRSEGQEPSSKDGDYDVDYGYMDCHASVIDSLKRFDIVVLNLNPGAEKPKRLIKRVIALPGESFYFVSDPVDTSTTNGDLYVQTNSDKPAEEPKFELVAQSFIELSELRGGIYPDTHYTLGKNEYFVCGDNRRNGASTDSRSVGPYSKDKIEGKAIGLEGSCTVVGDPGSQTITSIKRYWPTRLR